MQNNGNHFTFMSSKTDVKVLDFTFLKHVKKRKE